MKGTDVLRSEHKAIGKMLEVLIICGIQIREGNYGEIDTVKKLLDFSVNFTDRCHHKKEEQHLFPMLEEKVTPYIGAAITELLEEHAKGRETLKGIASDLDDFSSAKAIPLAQKLFSYAALLKEHIKKEDTELFPKAEDSLNDREQKELFDAFEQVEKEEIGEGVHEQYHNMIHEYVHKFGLSAPQ